MTYMTAEVMQSKLNMVLVDKASAPGQAGQGVQYACKPCCSCSYKEPVDNQNMDATCLAFGIFTTDAGGYVLTDWIGGQVLTR